MPRNGLRLRRFLSVHNWRGLGGLLRHAVEPFDVLRRYYLRAGDYPYRVRLRTPVGPIALDLYTHEDFVTVHEVFFREDYRVPGAADRLRTVVDFGANIGIASAYFLTRNPHVRVHAYEPVPQNLARARKNLAPFAGRLSLVECAVGTGAGTVSFGVEPTGRYGGIGVDHSEQIEVPVRSGVDELARIGHDAERIDLLKLDIEGMEVPILRALPPACLQTIGAIVAECDGNEVRLPGFTFDQYLSVARFEADA